MRRVRDVGERLDRRAVLERRPAAAPRRRRRRRARAPAGRRASPPPPPPHVVGDAERSCPPGVAVERQHQPRRLRACRGRRSRSCRTPAGSRAASRAAGRRSRSPGARSASRSRRPRDRPPCRHFRCSRARACAMPARSDGVRTCASLLAIVILAALGWSGWWCVQATARDRALDRLARRAPRRRLGGRGRGRARSRGFPNRVDTIVDRPRPRRPRRRLVLAAPTASRSCRSPTSRTTSSPSCPASRWSRPPTRRVRATSERPARLGDLPADAAARARPHDLRDRGHATRRRHRLERRRSARRSSPPARRADGTPFAHDLAFNAEDLALPAGLAGAVDRRGVLPAAIGTGRRSTRPSPSTGPGTGRRSRATTRCSRSVEVRDLALTWGKLDLRGRGTLAVDAEGFAEGRLDLRARNWRDDARRRRGRRRARPDARRRASAPASGSSPGSRGDARRPRRAARLRRRPHPARPDRDRPRPAPRPARLTRPRRGRPGPVKSRAAPVRSPSCATCAAPSSH